jgi:hypothetical protein
VRRADIDSADIDGIQLLIASLGQYQDAHGWEEFRQLMIPDCVMHMPDREYRGRDEIIRFLQSAKRGQHMLSIPRIMPLSADRAQADTPQVFFRFPELVVAVAGSYQDVVVKGQTGSWFLAQRSVRQACVRGASQ